MADKGENPYPPATLAHVQWDAGYQMGRKGERRWATSWRYTAQFKAGHEAGMIDWWLDNPQPPAHDR